MPEEFAITVADNIEIFDDASGEVFTRASMLPSCERSCR